MLPWGGGGGGLFLQLARYQCVESFYQLARQGINNLEAISTPIVVARRFLSRLMLVGLLKVQKIDSNIHLAAPLVTI